VPWLGETRSRPGARLERAAILVTCKSSSKWTGNRELFSTATPARSTRRRSARTGGGWSPPRGTAPRGCGTPRRAADQNPAETVRAFCGPSGRVGSWERIVGKWITSVWPGSSGGVQVELKRRGPVRASWIGRPQQRPLLTPSRSKKKNDEGDHTETEAHEPGTRTPASASMTTAGCMISRAAREPEDEQTPRPRARDARPSFAVSRPSSDR
jgi:hypothetical protein